MNEKSKLVIVCGTPLSGKTTIATGIQAATGFHVIDIDHVRNLNFGLPDPTPNRSEEAMAMDVAQMTGSWQLLIDSAAIHVQKRWPLIISATFSRPSYWDQLFVAVPMDSNVKVVWCNPRNFDDEEVMRRLSGRIFGVNCFSSVNSLERVHEVRNRFKPPTIGHLELDASPPNTVEECVKQALEYIR